MSELAVKIHKILNIILLLVIACLIGNMNDSEDEPEYGVRTAEYDIKPLSIEEVEITQERKELFSDYALDETYGNKVMYLIEMEVNNTGDEGIYAYEFDYILFKGTE
ncbi:MAG: hypothetical protein IJX12_04040, partial [Lachnospiraceae bacterium]|nr:hypothetical protein [Lachnospiraceae bacterium]